MLAIWGGEQVITAPLETVKQAMLMAEQSKFWPNARETLTAYGLAASDCCDRRRQHRHLARCAPAQFGDVGEPLFVAMYSIPKVTLYPVLLLTFGLGIKAKIAFGALHGIIPIVIFTLNAVRQVRKSWLRSGRAMSLTPLQTVRYIIIPATLPEIFSGVRIGLSLALLGTMLAELFASKQGLGFLLMAAIDVNDVRTIMALALMITAFALLLNGVLLAIDRRTELEVAAQSVNARTIVSTATYTLGAWERGDVEPEPTELALASYGAGSWSAVSDSTLTKTSYDQNDWDVVADAALSRTHLVRWSVGGGFEHKYYDTTVGAHAGYTIPTTPYASGEGLVTLDLTGGVTAFSLTQTDHVLRQSQLQGTTWSAWTLLAAADPTRHHISGGTADGRGVSYGKSSTRTAPTISPA